MAENTVHPMQARAGVLVPESTAGAPVLYRTSCMPVEGGHASKSEGRDGENVNAPPRRGQSLPRRLYLRSTGTRSPPLPPSLSLSLSLSLSRGISATPQRLANVYLLTRQHCRSKVT